MDKMIRITMILWINDVPMDTILGHSKGTLSHGWAKKPNQKTEPLLTVMEQN